MASIGAASDLRGGAAILGTLLFEATGDVETKTSPLVGSAGSLRGPGGASIEPVVCRRAFPCSPRPLPVIRAVRTHRLTLPLCARRPAGCHGCGIRSFSAFGRHVHARAVPVSAPQAGFEPTCSCERRINSPLGCQLPNWGSRRPADAVAIKVPARPPVRGAPRATIVCSPAWSRSRDLRLNRAPLCQLSYRGSTPGKPGEIGTCGDSAAVCGAVRSVNSDRPAEAATRRGRPRTTPPEPSP